MKKITIAICVMVSAFARAQQPFNCTSHQAHLERLQNDPQYKINQEQLELETAAYATNPGQGAMAATYVIPVVFHIIHSGGTGNISVAQILNQMQILNAEFKRLQPDTALTPVPFKPIAAPFDVEFRLATIDPSGNCTNGINRIYNTLTDCSLGPDDIKALSYWPSNKYLNIWLVESMHYSGTADCVGGGYATYPGGQATRDGVNIRGELIGSIGTAPGSSWGNFKGRYLIHELGHWFNLRHIWGDATCGNDQVSDTPLHTGANSGCPQFPHNPFSGCAGSNGNGEMFTDYMDYTNGPCLNMFTAGQVARMTAAINSSTSGRNNLWSPSNRAATGIDDPYTYPVSCVAMPEVSSYGTIITCVGDSVKLTDISYGGSIGSRQWDFFGNPASSLTDSIVKVVYNVPGVYDVGLTTTYLGSSRTATFTNKIHVLPKTPDPNRLVPFVDNLEDPLDFNNWVIVNRDNDNVTWKHTDTTGYSGQNSAAVFNFDGKGPLVDDLLTPAYDLTNVETPKLRFRLHYSSRTSDDRDKLQLFISKDCSKTWSSIYSRSSGNNLETVTTKYQTSHIPAAGSTEWRQETVNILPSLLGGMVRFKFTFTSGGGNNLFIDDINLDGLNSTGLPVRAPLSARLFPVPATDALHVEFSSPPDADSWVVVTDLLGKTCLSQQPTSGSSVYTLSTGALTDGVYFIQVINNGSPVFSSKFIKQSN